MGFLTSILLRIAKAVLQQVLSGLMQQFNVVQEQAMAPMRAMIQAVTGGIWIGQGADAFVEEVSSLMIPGVGKVGNNITKLHKDLEHARDTMDRADSDVKNLVTGRLADAFNFFS
jgi:uncharacterized protein YukE